MKYRIHPQTSIGLVELRVSDMEKSKRFYEDVVGLKGLTGESETELLLSADGSKPLLRLREISGAVVHPRRSMAGLYHFALLLPDRKSLGLALRNLIASGIRIGQADHLVSEALYISDPDNNGIEIYRDRSREEWHYGSDGQVQMGVDPIDWDGLLAEAGESPWEGLPPGTTMGHIHLHVSDLQVTRRFYEDVLGFDIVAHMADSALFISAGGYHHHLGLNVWAGVGAPLAPAQAAGLDSFEIRLPDRAALEEVVARLREAGIGFEEMSPDFVVLHDPSGIEIHLNVVI